MPTSTGPGRGGIVGILDGPLEVDPDRAALIIDGQVTTYRELDEDVERVRAALDRAGIVPGMRVALADDTSVLGVAALLAIARLGSAATLMNPRLPAPEMADLTKVARTAPVGVAGAPAARAMADAGVPVVLGTDDLLAERMQGGTGAAPPEATSAGRDDLDAEAMVIFTSGTTGTPKAVPLTHRALRARVDAYVLGVGEPPAVSLMCVPLVHIGGALGLLVALGRGTTVVVQNRFDAGEWLALVAEHRVTTSFVVPTMLHRILEHPTAAGTDLSSLESLTYGAAPASPELVRRAMDRLPGVALTNTFGQTETLGSITALAPGDVSPERLASVGKPLPGVEILVVDPGSGAAVRTGEIGELWVRTDGAAPTARPEGSTTPEDGWLHTGDLVRVDEEGYLFPQGRMADTINRGGEKFAPAEVEAVVLAHPGVREVAVVGVPDPEMGHRVGVAVVAGEPITLDELRAFCTEMIARFKLPERLVVVDELPYNDFGKVDRRAIRARLET